MNFASILKKTVAGQDLSEQETYEVISSLFAGELTEGQIGGFLASLAAKGECVDEITGGARAMRDAATHITVSRPDAIDTVGTGGDGGISFNVSTTVAFVAAGAGACVVKHGNRASSGRSGAADCLEALGMNVGAPVEVMQRAAEELGVCFLFAQSYHKAMRYAGPVRKQLGIRTLFNMLGPLTNPAGATHQLIGVYSPDLTEKFANVLKNLGSKHVFVVHGGDGMDEITCTAPSRCSQMHNGEVSTYQIDPAKYFGSYCTSEDLSGSDAAENAKITEGILSGTITGPKRNIVLINSAVSLMAADLATSIEEGLEASAKAIDSGAALEKMRKLVELSKSCC